MLDKNNDWMDHIKKCGTAKCAAAFMWVITEKSDIDNARFVDSETGEFDRIGFINYVLKQYRLHKCLEERNWQEFVDMDALMRYCEQKDMLTSMFALQAFNAQHPDGIVTADLLHDEKFDHETFIDRVVAWYRALEGETE